MSKNEAVKIILQLKPSDGIIVNGDANQRKILSYGKLLYDVGRIQYRLSSRRVGSKQWKVVAV